MWRRGASPAAPRGRAAPGPGSPRRLPRGASGRTHLSSAPPSPRSPTVALPGAAARRAPRTAPSAATAAAGAQRRRLKTAARWMWLLQRRVPDPAPRCHEPIRADLGRDGMGVPPMIGRTSANGSPKQGPAPPRERKRRREGQEGREKGRLSDTSQRCPVRGQPGPGAGVRRQGSAPGGSKDRATPSPRAHSYRPLHALLTSRQPPRGRAAGPAPPDGRDLRRECRQPRCSG